MKFRRSCVACSGALLVLVACGDAAEPEVAATETVQVGDTTVVNSRPGGIDHPVTLSVAWTLDADPLNVGTVVDAVLGVDGAVWAAVTDAPSGAAVVRIGEAATLESVVMRGHAPGALEGTVRLLSLAGGGVLALEPGTGRALTFDAVGQPIDTFTMRVVSPDEVLYPDRHGGWFRRALDDAAWLRHGPDGSVTDTFAIPEPWRADPAATQAVGRDGSLIRATTGCSRVERRAGVGLVVASAWGGDTLATLPMIAHDAGGTLWIGDSAASGSQRWRAFDRDGALQFMVALPAGAALLDRDGPYLLAQRAEGLVIWHVTPAGP